MKIQHTLITLMIVLIWAANFVIIKPCLEVVPPLALMSLRFFLTALLIIPFVPRPKGAYKKILALSMTLGTLHFGLIFVSLKHIEASVISVAAQLSVPFSAVLCVIFLKEKLSIQRIAGIFVAFLGVFILSGEPKILEHLGAFLIGVVAAAFWGVSSIQIKQLSYIKNTTVTAWFSLFASIQLFILSLIFEQYDFTNFLKAPLFVYGGLTYTVIFSTIIAYSLWYKMIALYPVSKVMPFMLLNPVFGISLSALFLGESITPAKMLGGGITLIGIALLVLNREVFKKNKILTTDIKN
jgi:O-acetylserine/cysteine efflux transporter